jgi:glycosyltransferase involved in cell wall biosynthesis
MPSPSSAKLLFYSDSRYYSGAEKVFATVIAALATDYPGSVVMLTPEVKENIIRAVPNWQALPLVWEFSNTQLKLKLSEISRIRHAIREHGLNSALINMWSPYANTLALIACQREKIPTTTCWHYFQHKAAVTGALAPIKLAAYRWAGNMSTRILTVSHAHKGVLATEFGLDAAKISVVHNGIDNPATPPKRTYTPPRKFLAVGTLEANKAQDYLIPLLAQVEGDWTLNLVGDGPDRAALEQLVQETGLQDNIKFLGRQSDMDTIYREHDVLVHPSLAENLSMAILEAISNQLTVIAHDVGGNNEIIKNHQNGWLIPYKDNAAWIKALNEATTGDLAADYARAAYATWQDAFQLQTMIDGYKDAIQRVL